jgi:hypothetical protein
MYNVLFDDSRMNNEQVHHVRPVSVALFFFASQRTSLSVIIYPSTFILRYTCKEVRVTFIHNFCLKSEEASLAQV